MASAIPGSPCSLMSSKADPRVLLCVWWVTSVLLLLWLTKLSEVTRRLEAPSGPPVSPSATTAPWVQRPRSDSPAMAVRRPRAIYRTHAALPDN